MKPIFDLSLVERLDSEPLYVRALDGTEFYPGLLGLNNLKQTDFVNVMVQAFCRLKHLRDFCLVYEQDQQNKTSSDLKLQLVA